MSDAHSVANQFLSHKTLKLVEGHNLFKSHTVISRLGSGNSSVYALIRNDTQEEIAMKEIVIKDEHDFNSFKKEVQLMKTLQEQPHPNIITYYDYCVLENQNEYNNDRYGYIFLERAPGALDREIINREQRKLFYDKITVRNFICKIISVHQYLQSISIAHCDIKPENILITDPETLEFKICDIGCGKFLSEQGTHNATISGTQSYLSPELYSRQNQQKTVHNPYVSDVFSLGLCLLYLLTFQRVQLSQRAQFSQECFMDVIEELKEQGLKIYEQDDLIRKALEQMLIEDPDQRPDFTELDITMKRLDSPMSSPLKHMQSQTISENDSALIQQNAFFEEKVLTTSITFETPLAMKDRSSSRRLVDRSSGRKISLPKAESKPNFFRVSGATPIGLRKKTSQPSLPQIQLFSGNQNQYFQSNGGTTNISPVRKKSYKLSNELSSFQRNVLVSDKVKSLNESPTMPQQGVYIGSAKSTPSSKQFIRNSRSMIQSKLNLMTPIDNKSNHQSQSQVFDQILTRRTSSQSKTQFSQQLIQTLEQIQVLQQNQNELRNNKICVLINQLPDCMIMLTELAKLTKLRELSLVMRSKQKRKLTGVLKKIVNTISLLTNLETLELKVDEISFGASELERIHLPNLKSLHMILDPGISEYSLIHNLVKAFGSCRLKTFELSLFHKGIQIEPFTEFISTQNQLEYLKLEFTKVSVSYEEYQRLFRTLNQLENLSTLRLGFYNCIIQFETRALPLNPNLKNLYLNFSNTQLGEGLTFLGSSISKLPKLESLQICLDSSRQQVKIVKALFQFLKNLENLKELSVQLSNLTLEPQGQEIDEFMIKAITQRVQTMKKLEILQLNFTGNKINGQVMEQIINLSSELKLTQYELIVPRVLSKQEIRNISQNIETVPVDIENLKILIIDQKAMQNRLLYNQEVLQIDSANYCSELDNIPLFACLDCELKYQVRQNICVQCTKNCHKNHVIYMSDFIARRQGFYSKLKSCQCVFDSCPTIKKQTCSSFFGCFQQKLNICERCPSKHIQCCYSHNSNHALRSLDFVCNFECENINQ